MNLSQLERLKDVHSSGSWCWPLNLDSLDEELFSPSVPALLLTFPLSFELEPFSLQHTYNLKKGNHIMTQLKRGRGAKGSGHRGILSFDFRSIDKLDSGNHRQGQSSMRPKKLLSSEKRLAFPMMLQWNKSLYKLNWSLRDFELLLGSLTILTIKEEKCYGLRHFMFELES